MKIHQNFLKRFFEKLSSLGQNNNNQRDVSIIIKNVKPTPLPKSNENGNGNENVNGTKKSSLSQLPEPFATKSQQKSNDSKSSNKTEQLDQNSTTLSNEKKPDNNKNFEKKTGDIVRKEKKDGSVHENKETQQEVQGEEDWVAHTSEQLAKVEKAVQDQKAAQTQEMHYAIAEPINPNPFSRIKSETPIPAQTAIGLLVVFTVPLVIRVLKYLKRREKQKEEEESNSFFVNAHLPCHYITLGQYVVATENCNMLNEQYNLNPKIETLHGFPLGNNQGLCPCMVGQVVAILDETIYQVSVEVFPNKRLVYKNNMTFLTPFVSVDDLNVPTPPSPTFKPKIPSRRLIQKYSDKITKRKSFQNIFDFLKQLNIIS